jgi:hypothetical protein
MNEAPEKQAVPETRPKQAFRERLGRVVRNLLPRQLQELWDEGLLVFTGYLLLAAIGVPLLVPLLASFWLSFARDSKFGPLRQLQESYVQEIQNGFSIDKLVAARLDYLLQFDLTLTQPGKGNVGDSKTFPLRLQHGQHAELRLFEVHLVPGDVDNCAISVADTKMKLLDVAIGSATFLTCSDFEDQSGGACSATWSPSWWKRYGAQFHSAESDLNVNSNSIRYTTLKFERAQEVRNSCGVVHAVGVLEVFKDVPPDVVASDGQ